MSHKGIWKKEVKLHTIKSLNAVYPTITTKKLYTNYTSSNDSQLFYFSFGAILDFYTWYTRCRNKFEIRAHLALKVNNFPLI